MKPLLLLCFLGLSTSIYAEDEWGVFVGQDGEYQSSGNIKFQPKLFIPINTDPNSVVFIDLRSYLNVQEQSGANLAFGLRGKLDQKTAIGVNGAVDLHYSKNGNLLRQGSLGLEFLSDYIDLSVNFYAPLNDEVSIAGTGISPYARLNNNNLEILWKDPAKEITLTGGDFNTKFKFPVSKGTSILIEGGVFYYFGNDYAQSVYGYQAQAQLSTALNLFGLDSNAFLGGGVRQDNTQNKPQWFVNLGVSVALNGKNANNAKGVDQGMYTSAMRRGTPQVAYKKEGNEVQVAKGSTTMNGHDYSQVFKLTADNDIVSDINSLGNNTLVVLSGDKGTINITQSVQVHQGQTILGKGTALVVNGPGGRTAVLFVGGSQATVKNTNNTANSFVLSSDVLLKDVNVQGGKDGVYVINADNTKVVNVSVSGANQNGVNVNNSTNVTIQDAVIQNSGASGVQITSSNNVLVQNSTIQNSGSNGVTIASSGKVTINDSSITNSTLNGVSANGTTTLNINNVNIQTSGAGGINATNVSNINIDHVTVNGAVNDGINLTNSNNGSVNITNTDIKNVGGHGVNVYVSSLFSQVNTYINNVVINGIGSTKANINYDGLGDLTISNLKTYGGTGIIATTDSFGKIKISKVDLSNVGNHFGIFVDAGNGTVQIDQATINASGSIGVYVANASTLTASSVEVNGSDVGISVYNSSDVVIADSIFAVKNKGIYLDTTDSVIVTDNFISDYGFSLASAIEVYNSSNVDVSNNSANDGTYGIKVGSSSNVSGDQNTGLNNLFDCYVYLSSSVIIGINSNNCIAP